MNHAGVTYYEGRIKPWCARGYVDGAPKHIGYYATAAEAAHAYDEQQREALGPDAICNFHEGKHERGIWG